MHSQDGYQNEQISMNTPGARLKTVRERSGFLTAKDAALAMGVPIATYTQHEKAERHLPARRCAEYARFFGTTPEFLLYGRDDAVPERVPVLNEYGETTNRCAVLPPSPSTITVAQAAIEGDGFAHYGFVALYDEPQSRTVTPDLDGRLCVVSILDMPPGSGKTGVERRLIRILQRGSSNDTFHLISSSGGLPLVDQKVLWAAPVIALVPAA